MVKIMASNLVKMELVMDDLILFLFLLYLSSEIETTAKKKLIMSEMDTQNSLRKDPMFFLKGILGIHIITETSSN
jgi:hypothetical protein